MFSFLFAFLICIYLGKIVVIYIIGTIIKCLYMGKSSLLYWKKK